MVIAPSASDLESSKNWVRSTSVSVHRPSQRGHMPPVMLKLRRSFTVCPARSRVTAPAPLIEATLKENAWGEPMSGFPSRLKRMRSIALASVAVPTVERTSAPIRSWSTMIAVVRPSMTSTSGRASVGMKPCTKALYVSLISRWDSAAIVPNTSELLPEPETPVNAVSRRLGISTLMSLRLFTRAPCTRIDSWLSAACADDRLPVFVAMLIVPPCVRRGRSRVLKQSEDVAIGVGDGGHQAATTDIVRGFLHGGARGGHLGELRLDVRHLPEGHRRGHALRSTAGHQPDVLALGLEADVIVRVSCRR